MYERAVIYNYYDGTEQLGIGKENESGQYRDRVITHHFGQPVSVPIAKQ